MKNVRITFLPLALQLICCCAIPSRVTSPSSEVKGLPAPIERANETLGADALIASGFFNGIPAGAAETWSSFTNNGQYRAARSDDFNMPEAAKRLYGDDINRMTAHPYVAGNINHDDGYHDFAVLTIAAQRDDAERFGLVIFTQPTNPKEPYKVHWLYRNRDLSKAVLEWWSGGLAIREYQEDGAYTYCYVNWHKQTSAFSCDREFIK